MAECPDGRTNRGTRSQFRIGLHGLGLCKGFYPINLGKIMDAGQSSQISSSSTSSRDLISPCKGTYTLTVREYEQTIDELKKENFDLKLKLYLCDETHKKTCRDNDSTTPNDEMVQVIVHLSSEKDSLHAELRNKDKLLRDALEQVDKLESEIKKLEETNADLQSELISFSELPSKEEILSLLEEKENFVNHIESLESLMKEKEEEIDTLNQKIEILANENLLLEERVRKRNIAIQGLVYSNYKENQMLPDELKSIVISATKAAKNKNKDDVAVAVKTFTSVLNKIMSGSELSLNQSEEKENIGSPSAKCLNEEKLEKLADSFISSQTVSPSRIARLQGLKEVLTENILDTEQTKQLDSFVHHSPSSAKMVHHDVVNIVEKGVIGVCDISPSTEENLLSFSERPSLQTSVVVEHNLIDIETVSSSPASCKSIPEKETAELDELVNILKENEQLKLRLKENLAVIEDLHAASTELKKVHLQERGSDAFKASQQYCASTQTEMVGSNLLNECEIMKLQKDAKLSDNVEELREDILLLLLTVEEKNKELSDVKQSLAVVQEDLKKALSTTSIVDKDFYMHERNELHEKLALSCSVNEELLRQLKNLERFMENLLQHKFDGSFESVSDKSDFVSSVSKCLNESLNLSRILSDHLSVCEGSKLFEECESFAYKNDSSEEKDLPYLGLNRLNTSEQQLSYLGAQKNNPRIGKESDSSQLCWRCWQQLNPPLNHSDATHLQQINTIPKPAGYPSSDSDIWSEPDRNVSMQRIGISLQNSPVSSKSPRKPRLRDKRISSRISSKEDTSSSEYRLAFKKRLGSSSRRLFAKESAKIQDFALDKYYFLVAEKYSRLKSLLEDLEDIQDGELTDDGCIRLHMLVNAVGDTLQKLHFAKETTKTPSVCGKCVMLELFSNLKASHIETDFITEEASFERKILQEFSRELCLLEQSCKEPFSLLNESVSRKSISTQSDILFENESTRKLENIIDVLGAKNNELNDKLEKMKQLLSKEREALVSVKIDNSHLLTEIDNLKIDLLDVKYKEKELSHKNEKLANELTHISKINSELNNTLSDVEQKRKESRIEIDRLSAELQKYKSDLIHMNEKCLENEKQLNEQIHMRENCENKLKILETESLSDKNYYLHKIDDLNAEKDHHVQELKAYQEKVLALEKENAVVSDRLQSKNSELLSLKETTEKLRSIRETQSDIENEMNSEEKIILERFKTENLKLLNQIDDLKKELLDMRCKEKEHSLENKNLIEELSRINKNYCELNNTVSNLKQKLEESHSVADQLKTELQKNKSDLACLNKKCLMYEKLLDEQVQMREKYEDQIKSLEFSSLSEKRKSLSHLDALEAQNKHYEKELQTIQEKMFALEKENAVINSTLQLKNGELSSLQEIIEKLQTSKETLISDYEKAKQLLSKAKETSESMKIENFKLSNKVKQLEEELSHMKTKEKENENLVKKLNEVSKSNSELNNTLKVLEKKRRDSNIEFNQLTAELQKNRSDLLNLSEKCLEYEKQLNEQKYLLENAESKFKNLESESQSEKNYHLSKINDLSAEKNQYFQELKEVQEKRLALEKENAIINDRLQSKNNELLSLKRTVEKLQSIKETQHDIENESVSQEQKTLQSIKTENFELSKQVNHLKEELLDMKYKEKVLSLENRKLTEELDHANKLNSELSSNLKHLKQKKEELSSAADELRSELQKNRLDLVHMNKKCLAYEKQLTEQIKTREKCESQLKTLELNSSSEKQNYLNQLEKLSAEKNQYEQELKDVQKKMLVLEKDNAVINSSLQLKNKELLSLQETIEKLQKIKETLTSDCEKTKQLLCEAQKASQSFKIKNLELSSQIKQLNEEMSHVKNKEKEICFEKDKLAEELKEVSKSNSELNISLTALEQKRKDSNNELDQMAAELQKNRSDLTHLSEKCIKLEEQLNEQKNLRENNESKLKNLNAEKNHYFQELESVQEKKLVLEKQIKTINDKLQSKNDELSRLQKTVEEFQKSKKIHDSDCEKLHLELKKCQECVTNLKEKCKNYEEIVVKFKETELMYSEQLKQLKANSATEKEKLLNEISVLRKEREEISQKLKNEKERYKKLKAENTELKENYLKSSQLVSTLKHRNEFFDSALVSSNKECDTLNKDLKCLRNTLQNLESKCLSYEKQLVTTAGMKDSLVECLLNINSEFSVQRQKLNEMCKICGNDNSVVCDEISKFIPVIDEDNVPKLCETIVSETKKLSQSVDMLFSILKNHPRSTETRKTLEENQMKTQSMKKQKELCQTEIEKFRLQSDQFQLMINELQKCVSEKENIIQCNDSEIQTLKEKLQNSQNEIDRVNQLTHRKDDEITMLQERIFNLQKYVNSIMTDKKNILEKSMDMTVKRRSSDFSNGQLPSKTVLTDTKMCQTDEWEGSTQSIDDSFTSASSFETGKRHCCEKYWKKSYSLQTKLTLCRKRIDILEKDRSDLKERLLQELQNKKDTVVKSDSEASKLVELESKLEKKKLFISELKNELLKTCNALIDKEKELDNLKQELAVYRDKSKQDAFDLSKEYPAQDLSSVDANVKTLKKHKWELIQTIFDIQKKFYEKKGIHLKYFDKFEEHVNNLYSLQLTPSVSKSESMPLLRSDALKEEENENVKKMADLELDIECLENLKIFLNRFLEPCVFKMPKATDKKSENKRKTVSSDRLSLPVTVESKKDSKHEITDILNLSYPEAFIVADNEKALSIDVVASNVSQHLDCIKNFVDGVTKKDWSDILDLSAEDSVEKAKVKSLLLNIVREIDVLHEGIDKLYDFNTELKTFDFVAPSQAFALSTVKLDTSDRESVLSEETIAVSRTESPISFEDICPIKLPHPETLQFEENNLKVGNRVTVIEPYSDKITVIDGSCDSVCQRSHYSSPDLGIESDPNHDSSAPEHKEEGSSKYQRFIREEQIFPLKPQPKTAFTSAESAGRWPGPKFGETFYAVGALPHYELLKQEIKESLVAIKSVLSRTGDGLHHIAKYTSPRKTLEYNTLKSIKDSCVHMEVCLKEANNLIGKFWTAPCPTEKEWKMLKEENQKLSEDLERLKTMIEKQEFEFKTARGKLELAQAVKDNIEKKISKKLVKTKKLIRQAELKLLENKCQNFPPLPKYPSELTEQTDTKNHAH